MSAYDFKIHNPNGPLISVDWIVALGTANSIHTGEPTIKGEATGTSTGAIKIAVDGDPLTTSTHQFSGIAKSESTDTVAAAGACTTWMPLPGIIYKGKAKTSSTADTAAEINALKDKRVVFDLTSTTWSVDAAATDANTNPVVIVGGDYRTTEVYFLVVDQGTFKAVIAGS
jgi:hypothetical protein